MQKIKILIVEDEALMREALISLFTDHDELVIAGDAANGREALKLMNRQIDIVILDIEMPVMNGRETLKKIKKYHIDTKVVMLSRHDDVKLRAEFILAGASAFLSKKCTKDELVKTLRAVYEDRMFTDNATINAMLILKPGEVSGIFMEAALSERELQVVQEIAKGVSIKAIALQLNIKTHTVNSHKKNAMAKTGTHSVVQLVNHARKNGLIL